MNYADLFLAIKKRAGYPYFEQEPQALSIISPNGGNSTILRGLQRGSAQVWEYSACIPSVGQTKEQIIK